MKKRIIQRAALLLCLIYAVETLSSCATMYITYDRYIEKAKEGIRKQTEEEILRALNTALIDMAYQGLPYPTSGIITVTASGLRFSEPGDFSAFEAAFAGIIDVSKLHPMVFICYQVDENTLQITQIPTR